MAFIHKSSTNNASQKHEVYKSHAAIIVRPDQLLLVQNSMCAGFTTWASRVQKTGFMKKSQQNKADQHIIFAHEWAFSEKKKTVIIKFSA